MAVAYFDVIAGAVQLILLSSESPSSTRAHGPSKWLIYFPSLAQVRAALLARSHRTRHTPDGASRAGVSLCVSEESCHLSLQMRLD